MSMPVNRKDPESRSVLPYKNKPSGTPDRKQTPQRIASAPGECPGWCFSSPFSGEGDQARYAWIFADTASGVNPNSAASTL